MSIILNWVTFSCIAVWLIYNFDIIYIPKLFGNNFDTIYILKLSGNETLFSYIRI